MPGDFSRAAFYHSEKRDGWVVLFGKERLRFERRLDVGGCSREFDFRERVGEFTEDSTRFCGWGEAKRFRLRVVFDEFAGRESRIVNLSPQEPYRGGAFCSERGVGDRAEFIVPDVVGDVADKKRVEIGERLTIEFFKSYGAFVPLGDFRIGGQEQETRVDRLFALKKNAHVAILVARLIVD